jgi:hypothetical protein
MSCPMQLRPHLKRVTTENPTLWELSGQDGYSIVEARRLTTQLTEDLSACSMQKTPFSIPWFAVALCVSGSISLYGRFYSITLLGYYDDDAFYYFQIARNIVTLHRSSFDGAHLTNGYHPLWMLTLVGLDLLSSGKTFFFLLQCIALASFMTTYVASRGIFRIFSDNSTLAEIAASAVALQCLLLIRGGMEITLTIPLTLLLCLYRLRPQFRWTAMTAVGYGLSSALIVASRLDSVLFVVVLFTLEMLLGRPASLDGWLKRVIAVLSCAIPLLLYGLLNHEWYHVWMPISGEAKQLRRHHFLSLSTLNTSPALAFVPYRIFVVYPTLLVILLCVVTFLSTRRSQIRRDNLIVSLSLLVLPFLQFLTFVTLSDWPIWPWYLYSFPLAMTGGFLLFFNRCRVPQALVFQHACQCLQGSVILLAFLFAAACVSGPAKSSWYVYGRDIEAFSQNHHGLYAMGDCAGTATYLINQPVIQLEGLVMDAPFLENIRQGRNLNEVLNSYNVRYYVTADAALRDGCYKTVEPIQAGSDSPHMHGSFCQAPIASYPHGHATLYIFDLMPGSVPAQAGISMPPS